MKHPAHLARSPFGQIPTLEDGDLVLVESGAIVLHIAQRHPGLLPVDEGARERAVAWMFAAIGTLDPPIMERSMCALLERDQPWYAQRLAVLDRQVDTRLGQLSRWLGDADWLEGAFSAGDLMTVHVLLRLRGSGLLDAHPNLLGYMARGEARPPTSAPSLRNAPSSKPPRSPGKRNTPWARWRRAPVPPRVYARCLDRRPKHRGLPSAT